MNGGMAADRPVAALEGPERPEQGRPQYRPTPEETAPGSGDRTVGRTGGPGPSLSRSHSSPVPC